MATKLKGKVSWFGGAGDPSDSGHTATGGTTAEPGIAVYNQRTLGGYWLVKAPNGHTHVVKQTDIGPAPWTHRLIDFTYSLLPKFGYQHSAGDFPTDAIGEATFLGFDKHKSLKHGARLIRQAGGTPTPGGGGGGGKSAGGLTKVMSAGGQSPGLQSVLASLTQAKTPNVGSTLADPAHSARSHLAIPAGPTAFQIDSSGQAGSSTPQIDQVLAALKTSAVVPGVSAVAGTSKGSAKAPSAATPRFGSVSIAPGANRAGASINHDVIRAAEELAGAHGKALTIGTGTNHNQFVQGSSMQSWHWTGNAADIPASGGELARLGYTALRTLGGYSKSAAAAAARSGGVFNFNRGGHQYQILFKTMVGGNHYNHLHLGVK